MGQNVVTGLDQGFEDRNELRSDNQFLCDDLLGPPLEPADTFAEHDAEGLQETPDLVLEPDAHDRSGNQPFEICAIVRFGKKLRSRRQLRIIDPVLLVGNLFGTADLLALPL